MIATLLLLAQADPAPVAVNLWTDLLLPVIPWLVVLAMVFVAYRKMFRKAFVTQAERTNAHIERMRLHMAAVEQKLDRIIELAERRKTGE